MVTRHHFERKIMEFTESDMARAKKFMIEVDQMYRVGKINAHTYGVEYRKLPREVFLAFVKLTESLSPILNGRRQLALLTHADLTNV